MTYVDNFFRPIFQNGQGQQLPDFTAETVDGRKVSASDYRGKRLVIACVGSWQSDSRPMLVQLRRKLRTLGGKWQCLVVSLDVDRE